MIRDSAPSLTVGPLSPNSAFRTPNSEFRNLLRTLAHRNQARIVRPMARMGVIVIVIVVLALANPSCRSSRGPASSDSIQVAPGQTNSNPADFNPQGTSRILRVNDETLTVEDVLEPLMPALTQEAGKLPGAQRPRIVIERIQAELIAQVQDLLLYQEASKDLTEPMMEALDRYVDQEIKDRVNREFGGRQSRFEAHLASMRMTLQDARERSRRRIIIVKYLQDNVLPRIADPTRRELLDYYHANMDAYTKAESRELYLIDIPKGHDADQARSEIERARSQLAAGEEFERVTRELSKGIHAADGGSWGHIKSPLQGRYADVSDVFLSLGPNQISDIIETDDAFFHCPSRASESGRHTRVRRSSARAGGTLSQRPV